MLTQPMKSDDDDDDFEVIVSLDPITE